MARHIRRYTYFPRYPRWSRCATHPAKPCRAAMTGADEPGIRSRPVKPTGQPHPGGTWSAPRISSGHAGRNIRHLPDVHSQAAAYPASRGSPWNFFGSPGATDEGNCYGSWSNRCPRARHRRDLPPGGGGCARRRPRAAWWAPLRAGGGRREATPEEAERTEAAVPAELCRPHLWIGWVRRVLWRLQRGPGLRRRRVLPA
jgi:hypothetical protein